MTGRALLLGAALTVLATVSGSYARFILHTTRLDQNHLSVVAVVPLVLLALLFARPFRLTRGELLVIFSMSLIGATMPTYFIGKLVANIAVPYYLASSENRWLDAMEPELPEFAVLQNGNGLRWFFEGIPSQAAIPWTDWVVPVFWWTSVIAAFYGCCLFLMVVLRRQWVENERIEYPLMEMPLALVEKAKRKGRFAIPVMNERLFWAGFAISGFVVLWNMVSYFDTTFPRIPWSGPSVSLGRDFPGIPIRYYAMVVGFGYFINTDLSFSLWVFHLLQNVEVGLLNRFGVDVGGNEQYSTSPLAIGAQSMGAFAVVVFAGLYMARAHLSDVYRKAVHGAPDVDDSGEIVSYRTAFYGLCVCGAYLFAWHVATGMDVVFTSLFLIGALVMYLGMTRVIAETGILSIRAPLMPQPFGMFLTGTESLSRKTMVSIALSYGWCGDTKTTIMPALAHSLKLFSTEPGPRRSLIWPVVVAMGVGVTASFVYTIHMGYVNGAANYGGIFTGGLARFPWDNLVSKLAGASGVKWAPIVCMTVGGVVTGGLMLLRHRVAWWPLHPIGFAAGGVYPVNNIIFPIFVAWLLKSVILRIGGVRGFRQGRPFFLGLILGHFVTAGVSFVVDMIWFPGQGHGIPFSD